MENRKARYKSRGPTAETRRILRTEEDKKRRKAGRSEKLMIQRDLQCSPLSKIEEEEEPIVTKRIIQTEDEKRLAQDLVQWKKRKELERKKQMQKRKPFIVGGKTNVIPELPLPLPKVSKRKAKVTTEQTNTKSQATGESGHKKTGKKNPQPSTFRKGNQFKDSKKHQLNTVMKTTEPAVVTRTVVNSKPSSVLQSFQSQLDYSLDQQKSTVDLSSNKPFSPFQFSFRPLKGNSKYVNPYENRHEAIQSKVSPVFSNTSPALEMREKSTAPCDADSQMYHAESVSSVTPYTIHPTVTSYLGTVETETEQLQSVCDKWQKLKEDEEELTEEVVGMIDTAIGKAQLLMSKKFAQFRQLCHLAKDASAPKMVKLSDLQGFWDMVEYQVEDVRVHFEHLAKLEENGWVIKEEMGTAKRGRKTTKRAKKRELSAKTKATRRRRMQEFKAKMLAAKLKKEGDMPFQSGSGDYQLSLISAAPALKTFSPAGLVKKLAPVTPSKRVRESFTTDRFYSSVRRSMRLLSSGAMERLEDLPEGSVILANPLMDNL